MQNSSSSEAELSSSFNTVCTPCRLFLSTLLSATCGKVAHLLAFVANFSIRQTLLQCLCAPTLSAACCWLFDRSKHGLWQRSSPHSVMINKQHHPAHRLSWSLSFQEVHSFPGDFYSLAHFTCLFECWIFRSQHLPPALQLGMPRTI